MQMQDLLSVERVIPRLKARDKRDALCKLAAPAVDEGSVPAAVIVRSVLECADLPAFGPGAGISLPHAFVPGLGKPIVIFARLEPAVDFGATDGSRTDLVALLLSEAESGGDHLQALACIARTMRTPDVPNLLRAAQSRDSLYAILCRSDERHRLCDPASAEGS